MHNAQWFSLFSLSIAYNVCMVGGSSENSKMWVMMSISYHTRQQPCSHSGTISRKLHTIQLHWWLDVGAWKMSLARRDHKLWYAIHNLETCVIQYNSHQIHHTIDKSLSLQCVPDAHGLTLWLGSECPVIYPQRNNLTSPISSIYLPPLMLCAWITLLTSSRSSADSLISPPFRFLRVHFLLLKSILLSC